MVPVVVLSCDHNAWIWKACFDRYRQFWPSELGWPVYLVTEKTRPEITNVTTICGGGGTWSENTAAAIKQIDAPHVLVMLDDFWPHSATPTAAVWQELYDLFQRFLSERLSVLGVAPKCHVLPKAYGQTVAVIDSVPVEDLVPEETPWFAALQAAIWVKQDFEDILVPHETCWSFEPAGGQRLAAKGRRRFSWECNWYDHTVMSGHLHIQHLDYVRSFGDEPPRICQ